MGYFLHSDPSSVATEPPPAVTATTATGVDRDTLLNGGDNLPARQAALRRLVAARAERELTDCLAAEDALTVQLAAGGLWEIWMNEAGPAARKRLDAGNEAMGGGDFETAGAIFEKLVRDFPDWAEARNKQATVLYLQGRPAESLRLCEEVLRQKPDHFGAWNGLTMCAVQIEDWVLALKGARASVRLQPNLPYNRQLLRLIESRVPQA